jgi:hypothetical protein
VQAELKQGVDTIFSTRQAFAAKLLDGSVVTWGSAGGGGDSSSVQTELKLLKRGRDASALHTTPPGKDKRGKTSLSPAAATEEEDEEDALSPLERAVGAEMGLLSSQELETFEVDPVAGSPSP